MREAAAMLCLILLSLASPVRAQTQIHRCIGANGGAVFTDQVCAALKATPVVIAPLTTSTAAVSTPPPTLCAGSIDALRQSVIDAFAARNAIRMAGLMLWDGYGRGSVIADIRSLTDLMKRPLLDVEVAAAGAAARQASVTPDLGGMSADPFAPQAPVEPVRPASAGNELVLRTAGIDASGGANERRFSVVRRAGCLWLRSSY
jgi:hypothetical protein